MSASKLLLVLSFVVLLMLLGIYVLVPDLPVQPRSRSAYRAFDFTHELWLADFQQRYTDGQAHQAAWLADPIGVALRLAGYPNADRSAPDRLMVFYPHPAMVTVIIAEDRLMDDSVAARELRVDLVKQSYVWRIEWAGGRYRCRRDLWPGWVAGTCS